MVANMNEIRLIMKKKSASMILKNVIKTTTNADTKKKLEDELIKMVLEL